MCITHVFASWLCIWAVPLYFHLFSDKSGSTCRQCVAVHRTIICDCSPAFGQCHCIYVCFQISLGAFAKNTIFTVDEHFFALVDKNETRAGLLCFHLFSDKSGSTCAQQVAWHKMHENEALDWISAWFWTKLTGTDESSLLVWNMIRAACCMHNRKNWSNSSMLMSRSTQLQGHTKATFESWQQLQNMQKYSLRAYKAKLWSSIAALQQFARLWQVLTLVLWPIAHLVLVTLHLVHYWVHLIHYILHRSSYTTKICLHTRHISYIAFCIDHPTLQDLMYQWVNFILSPFCIDQQTHGQIRSQTNHMFHITLCPE